VIYFVDFADATTRLFLKSEQHKDKVKHIGCSKHIEMCPRLLEHPVRLFIGVGEEGAGGNC